MLHWLALLIFVLCFSNIGIYDQPFTPSAPPEEQRQFQVPEGDVI